MRIPLFIAYICMLGVYFVYAGSGERKTSGQELTKLTNVVVACVGAPGHRIPAPLAKSPKCLVHGSPVNPCPMCGSKPIS